MDEAKRGQPRPLDDDGVRALLEKIGVREGWRFVLDGTYRGGEGPGAYRLRSHDEVFVLKVVDIETLERLPAVSRAADVLRERGYPAPEYLFFGAADGAAYVIQGVVPGEPIFDRTAPSHIARVLELNSMQADFPVELPNHWPAFVVSASIHGADGFCLHETMREHSTETSDLLDEVIELTRENASGIPSRHDLVHLDFTGANVLGTHEWITGVIDLEAARIGDRAFDLVSFMYYVFENEMFRKPLWDEALALSGASGLKVYFAHMIFRQTEWSVRFHDAKTVRDVLDRSRTVLDELGRL